MKREITSKLVSVLSFVLCLSCVQRQSDENMISAYLNQRPPGQEAEIFAPGLISTEFSERDAAFSPGGELFFFSKRIGTLYVLVYLEKVNTRWSEPKVAPFSGEYSDLEPCFSPDGKRLYFVSNRPLSGTGDPKDADIWCVERIDEGWAEPQNLGLPINTSGNEFYPSVTANHDIYFCARYKQNIGGEDLYVSRFVNGGYTTPVNLGPSINTKFNEYNAWISPDENCIIFTSEGWGEGFGGGDLWISCRNEENGWTRPKNLGPKVNTPYFEYCPSITPDGRYLFFTSNRSSSGTHFSHRVTYDEIIEMLKNPLNGMQDIYWIDAGFLINLR